MNYQNVSYFMLHNQNTQPNKQRRYEYHKERHNYSEAKNISPKDCYLNKRKSDKT